MARLGLITMDKNSVENSKTVWCSNNDGPAATSLPPWIFDRGRRRRPSILRIYSSFGFPKRRKTEQANKISKSSYYHFSKYKAAITFKKWWWNWKSTLWNRKTILPEGILSKMPCDWSGCITAWLLVTAIPFFDMEAINRHESLFSEDNETTTW